MRSVEVPQCGTERGLQASQKLVSNLQPLPAGNIMGADGRIL